MLLAQVWSAIVDAALATAALGLFMAWSVRRLPGQTRRGADAAALFVLRDGRSVDASPASEAVLSRIDRTSACEADGIPWPELSAVLRRGFPGHGAGDFFRRDTSPEEMAERVSCFLEEA